jgi:Ca2+-binding RTX toxin-like protein
VSGTGSTATSTDVGSTGDTVNSSVSFTLGIGLENLNLTVAIDPATSLAATAATAAGAALLNTNATGNSLANAIVGNIGNNSINGGTGKDTMTGGGGNDTYYVDSLGDTVTGGTGIDTIIATFVTGTDGSTAVVVGANTIYSIGTGAAAATATLVDNITLLGTNAINLTGNSGANTLIGNSANNAINAGTNPSTAGDVMVGLGGDDTYTVDSTLDIVVEAAGGGADSITAITGVSYDLGALTMYGTQTTPTANSVGVENLTLQGAGSANASGNSLNNTLIGSTGDNIIIGGVGVDTMTGNAGNDIYGVDSTADIVIDASTNTGMDTIVSSVSYTLNDTAGNALGVENLYLGTLTLGTGATAAAATTVIAPTTGLLSTIAAGSPVAAGAGILNSTSITAMTATGNALNNLIVGNAGANTIDGAAGADTIDGGAGKDVLTGGDGADVFRFMSFVDTGTGATAPLQKASADTITDFDIEVGATVFGTDSIDLNAINGTSTAFTLPNALNGVTTFTAFTAANQLEVVIDSSNTTIYGNLNFSGTGDVTPDFAIVLLGYQGTLALGANDIIS